MQPLNLPSFKYKLKNENGKTYIYDRLRKKYIVLTPEEWVRQHFLNYLIEHLNYSPALISVERGHSLNKVEKRTDIVVYNQTGESYILVELKAPEVKLSEKTFEQAMVYNKKLNALYIVISNGMQHKCLELQSMKFKNEIPESLS